MSKIIQPKTTAIPLTRRFYPYHFVVSLFLLVEVADTFDTGATWGDIFSGWANQDMIMCARSLDNRSFAALGTPFLDHFTAFQRQEPGIHPDIVHGSAGFGIDIQHASDKRSAWRRLKSIEELHGTPVDRERRRGLLFSQR
jgi:hypothetical protein